MSFVSARLRKSAGHHAARCTLNIAGVCPDYTEAKTAGCVLCHIRLPGECGAGQKPSDLSACLGCGPCHTVFDSNGVKGLSEVDWLFYALRGMARTHEFWREHGFLTVKGAR